MMQWLNMGGYWAFVWPSYLLTLAAIGLNIQLARRAYAAAVEEARRRAEIARGKT